MSKFRLTKKICAEARGLMDVDFAARADRALWTSGLDQLQYGPRIPDQIREVLSRRGVETVAQAVEAALVIGRGCDLSYKSRYAWVHYGLGGQVETKRYRGAGSHWHQYANPGVRWEISTRGALRIIGESSAGIEEINIPAPRTLRGISDDGCTHGDAYSLPAPSGLGLRTVRRRFGADGKPRGFAARGALDWEHGASYAEIIAERDRKLELAAVRETAARETARDQRRLRLLARISARVLVSREDAAAVGACRAGIDGWCERVGIAPDVASVPARDVFRLATQSGERRAIAAGIMAARRALSQVAA